jgi:hypothetical protein
MYVCVCIYLLIPGYQEVCMYVCVYASLDDVASNKCVYACVCMYAFIF